MNQIPAQAAPPAPAAPAAPPPELRIALVMNGGVSLAVWIGGVTAEYARLMAAGRRLGETGPAAQTLAGIDAIYDALLRLVDLSPRIDVIAGTSAGGVNAAYLGAAIARTTTATGLIAAMAGLRDVWINQGGIDDLLRNPADPASPSLLDGDGYYFDTLKDALARIPGEAPAPDPAALHLTLTTTLLTGEPQHIADDYGTSVPDISYRARFRFVRGDPMVPGDNFAGADFVAQLALAARATSSFPGAFEPVFCPIDSPPPSGRASMRGIALAGNGEDLPHSRYVIDGGVLDNKPLDVAIEAITALPATCRAARVLAYVAPDPGTSGPSPDAASVKAPPAVLKVVADSLVTIPMAQSISNQIHVLRQHNASVRGRRLDRTALATNLARADLLALATTLMPAYRQRRFTRLVDEAFEAINALLSMLPDAQPIATASGRQPVTDALEALYAADTLLIATTAPALSAAPAAGPWLWGHRAVVHIGWLAYDLLVRFERLRLAPPEKTAPLWTRLSTAQTAAEQRLRDTRKRWVEPSQDLPDILRNLRAGQPAAFDLLAMRAIGKTVAEAQPGPAPDSLPALADAIAGVVAEIAALARKTPVAPGHELARLLAMVAPDGSPPDRAEVLTAMLAWHVVEDTMGSGDMLAEEDIRFIQVSANDDEVVAQTRGPDARLAGAKLCSVQLGAFAGFYKRSWRAKDWTWGRRDAVGRILRVLLDPQRLRDGGIGANATWHVVNTAIDIAGTTVNKAGIMAELSCLDTPADSLPDNFPRTIGALADAIETLILIDEMDTIAACIRHDRSAAHAHISPEVADLYDRIVPRDAPLSPAARADLARKLLKPGADAALLTEPWANELPTDAALLTGAHALAVATDVIATSAAKLPWLSPAIAPVQRGTELFYIFARGNFDHSRGMLNVCFGVLLVTLTLILSHLAVGANYGAGLMTMAYVGFVVSYAAIVLSARGRWTWVGIAVFAITVALIAAGADVAMQRIPHLPGCAAVTLFGRCSAQASVRAMLPGPLRIVALAELLVVIVLLARPLKWLARWLAGIVRRLALPRKLKPIATRLGGLRRLWRKT